MKNKILIPTAVLTILSAMAFKQTDSEKKEFISTFYCTLNRDINISSSNGSFEPLEYQKRKGIGDQTQVLKLISKYESQGYKLIQYDMETGASSSSETNITAVLSK